MSGYFEHLIARSQGTASLVQPRLPARFEPNLGSATPNALPLEIEAETPAPPPFARRESLRVAAPDPGPAPPAPRPTVGRETVNLQRPAVPVVPQRDIPVDAQLAEHVAAVPDAPARNTDPLQPPTIAALPESRDAEPLPASPAALRPAAPIVHVELAAPRRAEAAPQSTDAPATNKTLKPAEQPTVGESGTHADNSELRTQNSELPPVVRVTIGRIEVRAVMPDAPAPRPTAAPSGPRLSLDAYLERQGGGR